MPSPKPPTLMESPIISTRVYPRLPYMLKPLAYEDSCASSEPTAYSGGAANNATPARRREARNVRRETAAGGMIGLGMSERRSIETRLPRQVEKAPSENLPGPTASRLRPARFTASRPPSTCPSSSNSRRNRTGGQAWSVIASLNFFNEYAAPSCAL